MRRNELMPTPTEISIHYNRKVQLDQYEPVQYGTDITVSLDEDDDPEEVYAEYVDLISDLVEGEIAARVAQKKMNDGE